MLRWIYAALALLITGSAAFITGLIIVPFYPLWALAVGGSEWSLWFGLIGVIGIGVGLLARNLGSTVIWWLTLTFGTIAVMLALIPPLQALPVARAHSVQLSLSRYLFGWRATPQPESVQTVTFASVGDQALQLDVYQPRAATNGPRPAIVVVHGGSWSGGARSDFVQWNAWLNANGYVVFDIDYRLQPQPNWREATGDVKCALGWVTQHAAEYNVDPERLALLGRSAGAQLALLAAYTPGLPELPPSCDVPATRVKAVIDFYGPADLVWGYNATADANGNNGSPALQRFLGGTPRTAPDAYALAAPINYVSAETPPTLMLHGGRDQLVGTQHTERLAAKLAAANVPHQAIYIPYAQHGFDYNFNGWGSQIVQPILLNFLAESGVSSQKPE